MQSSIRAAGCPGKRPCPPLPGTPWDAQGCRHISHARTPHPALASMASLTAIILTSERAGPLIPTPPESLLLVSFPTHHRARGGPTQHPALCPPAPCCWRGTLLTQCHSASQGTSPSHKTTPSQLHTGRIPVSLPAPKAGNCWGDAGVWAGGLLGHVTWIPTHGYPPPGTSTHTVQEQGCKGIPSHGPPNAQSQGGWKGTQVSWAGRGTRQRCQINQELGDLGSLPSTAESAVVVVEGGGTCDTQFP